VQLQVAGSTGGRLGCINQAQPQNQSWYTVDQQYAMVSTNQTMAPQQLKSVPSEFLRSERIEIL
jgi:hypothetical protein